MRSFTRLAGLTAWLALSVLPACNWRLVDSPNRASSSNNRREGVVALGPDEAWAVGQGDSQAMVQRWDGSAWSIVPTRPCKAPTRAACWPSMPHRPTTSGPSATSSATARAR